MTVAVDGAMRWTWRVSTGRRGYATPSGRYTAFRMEKEHFSKEWDEALRRYYGCLYTVCDFVGPR
jgi:hypothetical protein